MHQRRIAFVGGLAAVGMLVFSGVAAGRQDKPADTPPAKSAHGAQLPAWMAGCWVAEREGARTEEQWLPPAANTMVGMCRVTNGDKLVMYEFMAIERDADAVVMWMRHYRWNMKEREQTPIRWVLTKSASDEAVFEGPAEDRFKQLVYRKTGPDSMTTTLVPRDPAATRPLEFEFRLVATGKGKP